MTLENYTVQYKELRTDSTQCSPILLPKSSYSGISKTKEDNKRLSIGQMVVNNEGKIASLNQKFVSMWKLTECVVTARCERQIWRFIAEQLSNPYDFLVNIRNIEEQRTLEIQDLVELKDGRCFSQNMKPQWSGKTVVGRIYRFSSLL